MTAHVGPVPLEELLPLLTGAGTALVAARAWVALRLARRPGRAVPRLLGGGRVRAGERGGRAPRAARGRAFLQRRVVAAGDESRVLRRFDVWASRHRPRLAIAVLALVVVAALASIVGSNLVAAVALSSAFLALIGLAVGVRLAGGGGDAGIGPGMGGGGC